MVVLVGVWTEYFNRTNRGFKTFVVLNIQLHAINMPSGVKEVNKQAIWADPLVPSFAILIDTYTHAPWAIASNCVGEWHFTRLQQVKADL